MAAPAALSHLSAVIAAVSASLQAALLPFSNFPFSRVGLAQLLTLASKEPGL